MRRYRQRVLDIRDAESADGDVPVMQDSECDAGHTELLHLRLREVRDGVESRVGAGLRTCVAADERNCDKDDAESFGEVHAPKVARQSELTRINILTAEGHRGSTEGREGVRLRQAGV